MSYFFTIYLADRRIRKKANHQTNIFKRIIGTEENMISPHGKKSSKEGLRRGDSTGCYIDISAHIIRRPAKVKLDSIMMIPLPP